MSNWTVPGLVRVPLMLSVLFSCGVMLYVLVSYLQLPPEVPLFYTLPESNQYLVAKEWLFILPGFSFFVSILHSILSRQLFNIDHLLARLVAWVTVGLQVLVMVVVARIIIIIT